MSRPCDTGMCDTNRCTDVSCTDGLMPRATMYHMVVTAHDTRERLHGLKDVLSEDQRLNVGWSGIYSLYVETKYLSLLKELEPYIWKLPKVNCVICEGKHESNGII